MTKILVTVGALVTSVLVAPSSSQAGDASCRFRNRDYRPYSRVCSGTQLMECQRIKLLEKYAYTWKAVGRCDERRPATVKILRPAPAPRPHGRPAASAVFAKRYCQWGAKRFAIGETRCTAGNRMRCTAQNRWQRVAACKSGVAHVVIGRGACQWGGRYFAVGATRCTMGREMRCVGTNNRWAFVRSCGAAPRLKHACKADGRLYAVGQTRCVRPGYRFQCVAGGTWRNLNRACRP